MNTSLRLACWQGPGAAGAAEPLAALAEAARSAAASRADLLITPEMALTGYAIGAEAMARAAEPPDGPRAARIADIARGAGIALLVGLPERDGDAVYNSALLVGPDGTMRALYRKTHLYGDLDRAQFAPGAQVPPVVDLGGLRVGLLICYDVEFPENVRALALRGAELVLVPTALMHPFEIVARTIVVARAFENQVFVAYVNRCDREGALDYCGLSCVIGPDGAEIARAGAGEEILLADIDRAALDAARRGSTHLGDRRPELYRALGGPAPALRAAPAPIPDQHERDA